MVRSMAITCGSVWFDTQFFVQSNSTYPDCAMGLNNNAGHILILTGDSVNFDFGAQSDDNGVDVPAGEFAPLTGEVILSTGWTVDESMDLGYGIMLALTVSVGFRFIRKIMGF